MDRFPLFGVSQGCSISIAYAVRHPERVSHLILYGGFTRGRNHRDMNEERRETMAALRSLMRAGWGRNMEVKTSRNNGLFMPGSTREQADWFTEEQRRTLSSECAVRICDALGDINVFDLLAQVRAPTLVMHVREDAIVPIEFGRQMAAGIPGARFVAMPGKNHLFLENEPAAERFSKEVRLFLDG